LLFAKGNPDAPDVVETRAAYAELLREDGRAAEAARLVSPR
jgi:hypothetical protein